MSARSALPRRARPTRRAVLAGTAAGLVAGLSGCTSERDSARRSGRHRAAGPDVDPDVAVASEALAGQRAVLDLVVATQDAHPALRRDLAPLVGTHEAHVKLLGEVVPPGLAGGATAVPSASATPAAASRRSSRAVPRDPAKALADLVASEQQLTDATKQHAFVAESGAFARLLGSMAAAAAQHVVVLGAVDPGRGGGRR